MCCFCGADCPLNDSDGSQLLSNGEEKLAERLIKDSEPRKSIGGWWEGGWVGGTRGSSVGDFHST